MLSIIIPTYNSQKDIQRCLDSVLNQTFKDYEVIIIDGKSSDDTIRISKNYESKFRNFKLISEKDNGIYDAMNKGIKISTGEFLYFLGSDDFLADKDVLLSVSKYLNYQIDFLYGNVYNDTLKKTYDGEFNPLKICYDGICHQAIFYRRNLFNRFGNYDISMKIYSHIYKDKQIFMDNKVNVKYIDKVIANYSGTGISAQTFDFVYWDNSISLYKKLFIGKIPRSNIYGGLLPIVKYSFTLKGFILSIEAIIFSCNFSLIKYWISHPYQYMKLFIKLKILRLKFK
jgi:glycosyltransferase involved in cell wall biosynthesis